jgi:hypothetical protein
MAKKNSVPPEKTIEAVLKQHTRRLMTLNGVTGIAQGEYEGKPCIKVFVTKNTEEITRKIPSEIEGYAVRIEESGTFKALGRQ